MTIKDPFSKKCIRETLSNVVKNLEKRWGLTLVSFLPSDAQKRARDLQFEISKIACGNELNDICHGRMYIKFYSPNHLHSTHYTLRRSDPGSPVRTVDFVKDGHHIYELYKIINRISSHIRPINVIFDRLILENNGLGIILIGECDGTRSIQNRHNMLCALNEELPRLFYISGRKMDSDNSKMHKLHCTLGYLKRPPPISYKSFAEKVITSKFVSIRFTLNNIELVHHRYRSLSEPSEGTFKFILGERTKISEKDFISALNLN